MLRFDVVREMVVSVDLDVPAPVFRSEPVTDRQRAVLRYRARNAAYEAARRIPGFDGYSLRPGCDVVINGAHVALMVGV